MIMDSCTLYMYELNKVMFNPQSFFSFFFLFEVMRIGGPQPKREEVNMCGALPFGRSLAMTCDSS